MTRIAARLCLLLLVSLAAIPAHSQETAAGTTAGVLDGVRHHVRKEFYDRNALAPFEQVLDRHSGKPLSAPELSKAIDEALAALKVSHTGRYTPEQIEYYELVHIFQRGLPEPAMKRMFPPEGVSGYAGIGIAPRKIDGRDFVLHVYHGTPADRAGIKPGDEILGVDGKPYEPIGSFRDKAGNKAALQIRRQADGAPITIEVPVARIEPGDMFRSAIRDSVRIIDKDGRRIGYVRIWTYAARGVHSLLTELISSEPLKTADALVLDLRSRWGGAPPQAAELFVGRTPDMTLIDASGKRSIASIHWRKPVVALIDRGTRSGMEIYAYALRNAGIKLIGTRTAGAVLAARGFLLGDDSLLVLAVNDVVIDGQRLEGPGVTPDIEVAHDFRYAGGADPLVERALVELERAKAN